MALLTFGNAAIGTTGRYSSNMDDGDDDICSIPILLRFIHELEDDDDDNTDPVGEVYKNDDDDDERMVPPLVGNN